MPNLVNSVVNFRQLSSLSQLPLVRQIGFMFVLAASIALGTSIVLWSTGPNYTALYLDMPAQDSAGIVAVLEETNTQYKIDGSSGLISVPSDKVHQIRLLMANRGLPSSANRGYAVLEDDQGLGTSNFMEQARYHRALEQELVETIKQIHVVRNARVHLSIPKQTSFLRSVNKPSASVMLELIGLETLTDTQLNGILHLVTTSVAGLDSKSVSIVDQRGNLLSQRGNSELNNSSENIRLIRQFENDYSNRITAILTPIVGVGNVRTQVSADLDFTFIETTEESYNPNNTVVRSEQTQETTSGSTTVSGPNATPVEPGTLTEVPPPTVQNPDAEVASAGNTSQRSLNSTRNYEIDRSVSLIRTVPGSIRKLSVAVLVDLHGASGTLLADAGDAATADVNPELDQLKIDRITQLVREAIGFNAARGDSVSVIHERFISPAEIEAAEEAPLWEQAWFLTSLKQAGAGLVVIFLIFGVLRPAMQMAVTAGNSAPGANRALAAGGVELSGEHIQAGAHGDASALPSPQVPKKPTYDQNLSRAQALVQNEPARAARMIQSWLVNE